VADTTDFEQVRRFWQNPRVEQALLFHDIESSAAHVRMLGETGIVDSDVSARVIDGLMRIRAELMEGKKFLEPDDVDIHVGLERRLEEIVGEESQVLRIAKSRNDQIATDTRLWLRDAVFDIFADLFSLRELLLTLAERDLSVIVPGYTHMQPALPILLSHWWLAHEARLRRDFGRLIDFYRRLNCLPLGAGSLAGTSLPIDRELVARYLGFDSVIDNSLDAVSDRDYLVEFGAAAALIGTHLSQLASELLIWSTQEFGYVRIRKQFTFRSRNMPYKRNPELLEILRSRPSVINGNLIEFLTELKGLTMGYSQDLQEALPGFLELVEHLRVEIELTTMLLPGLDFDANRMHEMASRDLVNATNALDYLVAKGIEDAKAAKIVESLVTYCKERSKNLSDLAINEWQQFSAAFERDIYQHVTIEESVGSLSSYGGTSEEQVSHALERARESLQADRQRLPLRAMQKLEVRQLEGI